MAWFKAVALWIGMPFFVAAQQPIHVLFLGGGNTSHDPAAMRTVMQPVLEKAGMVVEYHIEESVLAADSLKRFDALCVYNAKKGAKTDGTPNLTAAQENALYAWVEAGHPFIAAHSASSSYLENPRWAELIGAEYTEHGADFKAVTITQPNHPAMAGVTAPTGWDEGRVHRLLKTDLTVLATLNAEKTPWTWVRPQGKGWVYYTSSGHDTRTWSDTGFQGQIVQAIRWGVSASQPVGLGLGAKRGELQGGAGRTLRSARGGFSAGPLWRTFAGPQGSAAHDAQSGATRDALGRTFAGAPWRVSADPQGVTPENAPGIPQGNAAGMTPEAPPSFFPGSTQVFSEPAPFGLP
jgi:type 1 glutamine amidotransferase